MTPDAYKGVRKITTAGVTLTGESKFTGFVNGATAQLVAIGGELIYDPAGTRVIASGNTAGITFQAAAGAYVPLKCQVLKPASFDILGYIG